MIEQVVRLRRLARSAYSPHPVARLSRMWRAFSDPSGRGQQCAADILLLPLAGLTLAVLVLDTVPGASEALGTACSAVCTP